MRKGKFLHPIIYKFAKSGKKEFVIKTGNKNLNIRSSFYLKKFSDCVFNVHNGKHFVINDTMPLKILFKTYPYYNFRLGQFSYNRQIIMRNKITPDINLILEDLKKKKGIFIKNQRKKKYIYNTVI